MESKRVFFFVAQVEHLPLLPVLFKKIKNEVLGRGIPMPNGRSVHIRQKNKFE